MFFAKFDEIPTMLLQDIKETKRYITDTLSFGGGGGGSKSKDFFFLIISVSPVIFFILLTNF